MALGFIKKVFTFGKEKAAQTTPDASEDKAPVPQSEIPVLSGASHVHLEDLPLADDPVLAEEMDTAGGPSPDLEAEQDQPEASELTITEHADLEMVPLALLEAEEVAEQDESLATGEPVESPVLPFHENPVQPADVSQGVIAEAIDPTETPVPVSLPKGFSTAETMPLPPVAELPQVKQTWFQRLTAGLFRTSSQLTGQITALFTKRKLDDETLEELEDLLIQADLGVETALRVTDTLASERYGKDVTGEDVTKIMATEIVKVLKPVAKPLALDLSHKPHVILVVGVNGTGKTTTIGKLAAKLSGSGLKVMLAAGDTFRAAAIEQLKIWADRTGSTFLGTKLGADAAGLAYEAFEKARADKADVLIIDTAGRLQNKAELMAELEKIVRVLGKLDPDAPHTVLQTLDATTGQNALQQVEIFRNVAGVNGLIMTKLDGTARGGILVAIAAKHKLPVYFIGVGEGIDDLEPFEAEDFASAIAGIAR
ncbi:MAG: signal recognition particle-docking protein FtsY [Agrobacterium albertimagni]|uniref:Signal recognition particle receptor FtsY n=1 Tax=Agrobacterium albertimagni AOL15 TaxID=1156935 RepID=K2Q7F2_9HYPH|nr:signal recognition particle-docking protein FtsY [Agrobacterium albertimagni]EKF61175.1 signal recognition particle-docking protein FtsY [Agrobacterium albertimagni AOL15]